ncbi:hypothetical protein CEXT_210731 [Caerostris extrusa]|uniref:Uncharacterized protein n=1 Tax=Caerostris extrusa TaxID=172846 RepID=A0AAV4XK62_CAEEX|nr:hypothetical protein CEXT_210731 [Caerostris extrusa]
MTDDLVRCRSDRDSAFAVSTVLVRPASLCFSRAALHGSHPSALSWIYGLVAFLKHAIDPSVENFGGDSSSDCSRSSRKRGGEGGALCEVIPIRRCRETRLLHPSSPQREGVTAGGDPLPAVLRAWSLRVGNDDSYRDLFADCGPRAPFLIQWKTWLQEAPTE